MMAMNKIISQKKCVCPVCDSLSVTQFYKAENMPVCCNVLWENKKEALMCPRGDIVLVFCEACGFIWNTAFEADRVNYSLEYENSLHYSKIFKEYSNFLADELIQRYELLGKSVIDIGCGKGYFLKILCEKSNSRGIGFDKSYEDGGGKPESKDRRVIFIQDYYSQKYKKHEADLIVSRHVLEHVYDPVQFLSSLRHVIGDRNIPVFFEVPNMEYILKKVSVWDVIYEHFSYFLPCSLRYLFNRCGFSVKEVKEGFGGQYLAAHAVPSKVEGGSGPDKGILRGYSEDIERFRKKYNAAIKGWREKIKASSRTGKRVVVWGAGSKGVMFLNMAGKNSGINHIVDINPKKIGKYVPGAGQEVVPPEFVKGYMPDIIYVMNPIYTDEIKKLVEGAGIYPSFSCIKL